MIPHQNILLIISMFISQQDAAKVLVIPANVNSHVMFMGQIGAALAEQGDKVTLLLPSNTNIPVVATNSSKEVIQYKVEIKMSAFNIKENTISLYGAVKFISESHIYITLRICKYFVYPLFTLAWCLSFAIIFNVIIG